MSHLQSFLELDELEPCSSTETSLTSPDITSPAAVSSPLVRLDGAAFSWSGEEGQNTVSGVSLSLTKVSLPHTLYILSLFIIVFVLSQERPLLVIVGPVGAGKVAILQQIHYIDPLIITASCNVTNGPLC